MKRFFIRRIVLSFIGLCFVSLPSSTFAVEECGNIIQDLDGETVTTPIEDCDNPFGVLVENGALQVKLGDEELINGETYPVLNAGSQEISIEGSLEQIVYGSLYFHEESDYRHEVDVSSDNPFYTFTKPGTYTFVVFEYSVFQVRDTLFQKLKDFLIPTAFASFSEPSRIITFSVTEPIPEKQGISNILFIPGIQASRLYTEDEGGNEEKLWEPGGDDDVLRLAMTDTGVSVEDIYMKDVLDETLGVELGRNVYKGFLKYLEDIGGVFEGPLVETFPYDWRHDVFDIVENGTVNDNGVIKRPTTTVAFLAAISPTEKVTIVAHSNGGLLAKAIMRKLEDEGKADLVDKIIFIAVPHIGTPKGVMALLHGYDQSHALGLISSDEGVRKVMKNMPGVYGLLPSEAYISSLSDPLISFDSSSTTESLRNAYGFTLSNMEEYKAFLKGNEGRLYADDRVNEISTVNSTMLDNALQKHQTQLDDWKAPEGVDVFNIVGTGLPTPHSIEYREFSASICAGCPIFKLIEPVIRFTNYGDNTVVSKSADDMEKGNIYFNLRESNSGIRNINHHHADITETETVQSVVNHILHGSSTDLIAHVSNSEPTFNNSTDIITIHSPARISVRDSEGNVTGRTSSDGTWLSGIPGSDYFEAGEVKYLLIPSDTTYSVVIEGEGAGVYTHERKRLQGSEEESEHHFTATITPTTVATYTKTDGVLSEVSVDVNGDGKVDTTMTQDGTIIPSLATYDDLYKALNALALTKAQKKFLLELARQAEEYSQSKRRLHRILERTTLLVIKNKIGAYQRLGLITKEGKQGIVDIINDLLKKQ